MSSALLFIGNKIASNHFIDEITPSLKESYGLKCFEDVVLNCVKDKGKPWCKLLYKLLKEYNGYDPLLDISPYPKLIQLKYFLGGIHHCVTVVVKWVFESNFSFVLSLTKDHVDYCCINDNKAKIMNGYKVVLKSIRFFTKYNNKNVIHK